MSRDRRRCGVEGEALAAAFLAARGYALVARNFRCRAGEIDLVLRDGVTLVFCEVRTRRGWSAGSALESVTAAKQRQVIAVAEVYLAQLGRVAVPVRFDVVAVEVRGLTVALEHVRDAFRAD